MSGDTTRPSVNIPASGTFEPPPAHAPQETSQPLSAELVAEQLARAQANERAFQMVAPAPGSRPAPAPPVVPAVAPISGRRRVVGGQPPQPTPIILTDADQATLQAIAAVGTQPVVATPPVDPVLADGPQPHQRAWSNTDSPSRGQPRPITDPGKVITGGFGPGGAAQYYALTGEELRVLVRRLIGDMDRQLENDLRFSVALCYPRVRAKIQIIVEAAVQANDQSYVIERRLVEEKTPEAVLQSAEMAAQHEQVVFMVVSQAGEVTADGTVEVGPDQLRDELGLPKPGKRLVQTGAHTDMVDIVDPGVGVSTPAAAIPGVGDVEALMAAHGLRRPPADAALPATAGQAVFVPSRPRVE